MSGIVYNYHSIKHGFVSNSSCYGVRRMYLQEKNRIKGAFSFLYRLTRLHVRKHIIRIRTIGKEIREEKGGKQITDKVDPNKFKFKPISIHFGKFYQP